MRGGTGRVGELGWESCTRVGGQARAGEFTEPNGKHHSLSFIMSQMIGTVSLVATGRGRAGMGSTGLPIRPKRKCILP